MSKTIHRTFETAQYKFESDESVLWTWSQRTTRSKHFAVPIVTHIDQDNGASRMFFQIYLLVLSLKVTLYLESLYKLYILNCSISKTK